MSKHDEARRAFLVAAAVTGAAAGAALVPEAYAKEERPKNKKNGAAPAPTMRTRLAQSSAHSSTATTPRP